MLNALGVEKLQEYTKATTKAKGSTLRAQAQMFDISANQLSGNVPAFMYANNVPDSVRPYVAIQVGRLGPPPPPPPPREPFPPFFPGPMPKLCPLENDAGHATLLPACMPPLLLCSALLGCTCCALRPLGQPGTHSR